MKSSTDWPFPPNLIRLFLCGDVMTGRGIDQVLPHPGDPTLHEPYIHDAGHYAQLAERFSGTIPRPVTCDYIWGDALPELDRAGVDARIINLETSITSSDDYWRGKEIHYRMSPRNIGCLTAARIDCCCLANNHVLDWGFEGLSETLRMLDAAGIAHAGAGRNAEDAAAPAVLDVPGKGRVLVFSYGSPTSGIPPEWAATAQQPGINFLGDISAGTAHRLAREMRGFKHPGDVVVASIHWGGNWGYHLRDEEIRFAHDLVEQGVDIVHGHSSHHVKAMETHADRLVLYGCGDFLNDYEGIGGGESFRSDLRLMVLTAVDPSNGRVVKARLIPMSLARFRLQRATEADAKWLCNLLGQLGAPLTTQVELLDDHTLSLCPFALT